MHTAAPCQSWPQHASPRHGLASHEMLIAVPRLPAGPPAAGGCHNSSAAQNTRPSRVPWPEGVARHGCALCAGAAEPDPRTGRRLCSLCSLANGLLLGDVGAGGGLGGSPASVNQLSLPTGGGAVTLSSPAKPTLQHAGGVYAPPQLADDGGPIRLATTTPGLSAGTPPPGLLPPMAQGHGGDGGAMAQFPWMLGSPSAQLGPPPGHFQGAAHAPHRDAPEHHGRSGKPMLLPTHLRLSGYTMRVSCQRTCSAIQTVSLDERTLPLQVHSRPRRRWARRWDTCWACPTARHGSRRRAPSMCSACR